MKMTTKQRAIDKIYKRRDRYDIPDWQRQEVWSRSKKQNLIDSILRQWKLPKFYFVKISGNPEAYEVLDGQQRLSAIFEFFDGDLQLADDSAERFGGKFYKDLPDATSDLFDDFEITFDEIEEGLPEESKKFFQRLQEGLSLTSAEKLNSEHSSLRDFLVKKAKHAFFKRVAASDRRYGHLDILAKVAAIEVDGIDVGFRYDMLRAVFESQSSFSSHSLVAKRITSALSYVEKGFSNEQANLLRNRTTVQALLTLTCRVQQSQNSKGREKVFASFFAEFLERLSHQVELGQKATEPEFLDFQRTLSANVKSGARIRQVILLRRLLLHDPSFAEAFDAAAIAESSLDSAVKASGTDIVGLITELNENYSANNGADFFKATNKTAGALVAIGEPIRDFDQYTKLIDNLYFLFHEGPSDRGPSPAPKSFVDVNTLRTDLRHDVDHGKGSKVRAKKKKAGRVFETYSGAPSPVGFVISHRHSPPKGWVFS